MSDNLTGVLIMLICAILFYKFACLMVLDVHPGLARSKPEPAPAPKPAPAPAPVPEPPPEPAAPVSEEMQHALCFFTEMAAGVKTGKVAVRFDFGDDSRFYVTVAQNDARMCLGFPRSVALPYVYLTDGRNSATYGRDLRYTKDNVPPEVWAAAMELRDAVYARVAEELAAHQAHIAAWAAVPPPRLSSFAMFKQTNCGCVRSQETK